MGIHNFPINPQSLKGMGVVLWEGKFEECYDEQWCYLKLPCVVASSFTDSGVAPALRSITPYQLMHQAQSVSSETFSRAEKSTTSQNQVRTLYFKCTKSPGTPSLVRINQMQSKNSINSFKSGGFFPFWFSAWFETDVWHPCPDLEEGASFPGPALLHTCWPTTNDRPAVPGLFTVQTVSQGWLWLSSNFTFFGLAKSFLHSPCYSLLLSLVPCHKVLCLKAKGNYTDSSDPWQRECNSHPRDLSEISQKSSLLKHTNMVLKELVWIELHIF